MRLHLLGFTIVAAVAGFTLRLEAGSSPAAPALPPVRVATLEPGVVPTGTPLVVRTGDAVRTRKYFQHTIYGAMVAEDVLDLKGHVLIPKGSPVEMVVRLLPYYGPGGVGMTELALDIEAINIKGVFYPVGTGVRPPLDGGLWARRYSAHWVGGTAVAHFATYGARINVPANALLAFQIEDPIRLRDHRW
jgi:hypothetical protein